MKGSGVSTPQGYSSYPVTIPPLGIPGESLYADSVRRYGPAIEPAVLSAVAGFIWLVRP
jgi:hypothetical protein